MSLMVHNMDGMDWVAQDGLSGAQSIGRAVAILRFLATQVRQGSGLAQVVDQTGLSKPTCRRILLALIDAGFVEQDLTSRRYFLGPECYLLGVIAAERYGIHRHAMDCVARLAEKTGDAAFFQVRRGEFVVCLQREDGNYPLRSHVLMAGDRHFLGVGAGPLAILAAMGHAEATAILQSNGVNIEARHPALTLDKLRHLVEETRAQGYSFNRGMLFPGSWGIGMAICAPSGRVEACLSLAAVESRMQPDRVAQLVGWLRDEVRIVEKRLAQASTNQTITAQSIAANARRS